MSNSILIVEDHQETREMLRAAAEDSGFRAHSEGGVAAAKEYLAHHRPLLIILDIALPDGSGLDVCGWAREHEALADIPIIALTGRDEISDKEKGFSAGVDQYLTKPIDMGELLMWIRALLRRVSMDKSGGSALKVCGLELDAKAQVAVYKGVKVENLTRREFQLLYALVKNSPKILSRKDVLSHVWRTVAVENLVDTHMYNLRRKLPPALAANIQSVPGRGFRFFCKE